MSCGGKRKKDKKNCKTILCSPNTPQREFTLTLPEEQFWLKHSNLFSRFPQPPKKRVEFLRVKIFLNVQIQSGKRSQTRRQLSFDSALDIDTPPAASLAVPTLAPWGVPTFLPPSPTDLLLMK